MRTPLLALLLAACAGGKRDSAGDTAADSAWDTPSDSAGGSDSPPTDSVPWWEDTEDDADGDGVSVEDGDCDDLDDTVFPGAEDHCDGRDQDCDGAFDEDFDDDEWEPNDDDASWVGVLVEEDPVLVFGFVWDEDDADGYAFEVEDSSWSWFSIEAWLYDVPADADYALELRWVEDPDGQDQGVVAVADDGGLGDDEVLDWGGSAGTDDSGRYEIWLTSSDGASCETPYTLQIGLGGW